MTSYGAKVDGLLALDAPVCSCILMDGANFRSSFRQLCTSEVGSTIRLTGWLVVVGSVLFASAALNRSSGTAGFTDASRS